MNGIQIDIWIKFKFNPIDLRCKLVQNVLKIDLSFPSSLNMVLNLFNNIKSKGCLSNPCKKDSNFLKKLVGGNIMGPYNLPPKLVWYNHCH
jgi:hypothetical protein